MEDMLLLEDNLRYQEIMIYLIPNKLTYKLVRNGKEFEEYLAEGGQARLFFLDDKVPDAFGEINHHFIKHCTVLFRLRPDAKVFYHGSTPGKKEIAYCKEHNIKLVERVNIGDIIIQELQE